MSLDYNVYKHIENKTYKVHHSCVESLNFYFKPSMASMNKTSVHPQIFNSACFPLRRDSVTVGSQKEKHIFNNYHEHLEKHKTFTTKEKKNIFLDFQKMQLKFCEELVFYFCILCLKCNNRIACITCTVIE